MNKVLAQGRHIELRDPVNNNEKFYRIFTVGLSYTLFQWGRIGTNGMWQIKGSASVADASDVAYRQYQAKCSEGYYTVLPQGHDILDFTIDERLQADLRRDGGPKVGMAPHGAQESYRRLVAEFVMAMGSYGNKGGVSPRKSEKDKNAEVLANLLAKRDKYRKILNPDAEVEPEPEPAVPVVDPNSIAARLAAALAEAKVKS